MFEIIECNSIETTTRYSGRNNKLHMYKLGNNCLGKSSAGLQVRGCQGQHEPAKRIPIIMSQEHQKVDTVTKNLLWYTGGIIQISF